MTAEAIPSRRRRVLAVSGVPLLLSALALVLAATLFSCASRQVARTEALHGDGLVIDGNTARLGTIDISGPDTVTGFDIPAMMPGDSYSMEFPVTNSGTGRLRYRLQLGSVLGDADLLAQLRIQASVGGDSGAETGAVLIGLADGAWLLGNTVEHALDGAVGEDGTALTPGSDTVTVTLSLPLTAGDETQGTSGSFSLLAHAEQTRNNPFAAQP